MKYLLAGLLLYAVLVTPASALTESFDYTIANTATAWSQTMLFNQWNPVTHAGYTLTQVDIELDATFGNTANWVVLGGTDVFLNAWTSGTIKAYRTWGGNSLLVQADPYGSVMHTNLGPGDNDTDVIVGTDYDNLYTTSLAGDLSAFTGAGQVGIFTTATGTQFAGFGGENSEGIYEWQTPMASAYGKVTYTFTPNGEIPEPATLGLFALGLVGLGVVARRRKSD